MGQAPLGDDAPSALLRQGWWHVIASLPSGSTFYQVASEARTFTRQASSTVAHRNAFRMAMLKAITRMVETGVVSEASGLARGGTVNARYGESRPIESVGTVPAWAAATPATPPTSSFSGARVRRCPKCPMQADGTPTVHPGSFECKAEVTCQCGLQLG